MLSTPEPPVLAPDAYTQQITDQPVVGEYGIHSFGRDIATHLTRLLHVPVGPPLYRENRWDQQPIPKASTFTLTVDVHAVLITMFEVKAPLMPASMPAYTIHLDSVRVPFEIYSYRDVDWQLARTIWIAVSDLRIAAQRANREAAEAAEAAHVDQVDQAVQRNAGPVTS